jgi:hypothetical protein
MEMHKSASKFALFPNGGTQSTIISKRGAFRDKNSPFDLRVYGDDNVVHRDLP